ncbi:hypothetical protein [Ruminococcus sp.]|uniref:hypothetical protein n=1 Tax=Ruminococcus sp. TaxID=41978 RepID=UPI0025D2496C|nr:hypothetical protein [Ruminococcus sp.]
MTDNEIFNLVVFVVSMSLFFIIFLIAVMIKHKHSNVIPSVGKIVLTSILILIFIAMVFILCIHNNKSKDKKDNTVNIETSTHQTTEINGTVYELVPKGE